MDQPLPPLHIRKGKAICRAIMLTLLKKAEYVNNMKNFKHTICNSVQICLQPVDERISIWVTQRGEFIFLH